MVDPAPPPKSASGASNRPAPPTPQSVTETLHKGLAIKKEKGIRYIDLFHFHKWSKWSEPFTEPNLPDTFYHPRRIIFRTCLTCNDREEKILP
jgi:hypothetical protein